MIVVVVPRGGRRGAQRLPGRLMNGPFAPPEPLQVSFSKSSWSAPVSNDPVTLTFTQHVRPAAAARSGTYWKMLTFPLSTTTPKGGPAARRGAPDAGREC